MVNTVSTTADDRMSHKAEIFDSDADLLSPSGTWSLVKLAERLSARPYLTIFDHPLPGMGETVLVWHPEFTAEGIRCCVAAGRTEAEAAQHIEKARYLLILALLHADLPVPEPVGDTTPYVFPELLSL